MFDYVNYLKRKAFLPMWDSSKPKMTTSATLGLGKNCPHTYKINELYKIKMLWMLY